MDQESYPFSIETGIVRKDSEFTAPPRFLSSLTPDAGLAGQ